MAQAARLASRVRLGRRAAQVELAACQPLARGFLLSVAGAALVALSQTRSQAAAAVVASERTGRAAQRLAARAGFLLQHPTDLVVRALRGL